MQIFHLKSLFVNFLLIKGILESKFPTQNLGLESEGGGRVKMAVSRSPE